VKGERERLLRAESAFIVVDLWRVREGQRDNVRRVLRDAVPRFREQPGVLSVDFTHVDGDADRYLVVFRYASAEAREAFVASDLVRSSLATLEEFWELDSPVYRGTPSGV
jgi:heme-degrading monooxygenase HmoA